MSKIFDFAKIWEMKYPPLMTKEELEFILKVAEETKPNLIVELGTYVGGTAVALAKTLPESKIYAVDLFVLNEKEVKPSCLDNIKDYPQIKLFEMSTNKASQEIKEEIDFLIIDACHDDGGIIEDLKNWLPKVKAGGIVVFDDYFNDDYPAIRERVEEFTGSWKFIGQAGAVVIKQK